MPHVIANSIFKADVGTRGGKEVKSEMNIILTIIIIDIIITFYLIIIFLIIILTSLLTIHHKFHHLLIHFTKYSFPLPEFLLKLTSSN